MVDFPVLTNVTNGTVCINSTILEDLVQNANSTVSWQSALWALIALALNSMTQASAADHYLSSTPLSPARSSPTICAADSIVILLWAAFGLQRKLPFRKALALSRKHLKLNPLTSNHDGEESTTTRSESGVAQEVVQLAYFVLGPLPQAFKLVGMQGIPWTTTWGILYLVSYLITLTTFLHNESPETTKQPSFRRPQDEEDLPSDTIKTLLKTSHTIYKTAFAAQIALWIWTLVKLSLSKIMLIVLGTVLAGWLLQIIFLAAALTIIFLPPYLFGGSPVLYGINFAIHATWFIVCRAWIKIAAGVMFDAFTKVTSNVLAFVFGLCIIGFFIIFFITIAIACMKGVTRLVQVLRGTEAAPGGPSAMPLLGQTDNNEQLQLPTVRRTFTDPPPGRASAARSILQRSWNAAPPFAKPLSAKEIKESEDRGFMSMGFALTNLMMGSLYYGFLYDETGTRNPGWSGMLG